MTETLLTPSAEIIHLSGISWRTYEALLSELSDRRLRLTYNRGTLEIMAPSPEHELNKTVMRRFVETLEEESNISIYPLGSTTFQQPELSGAELDECFYLRSINAVRGKKRLDLTQDPAPDLVEVNWNEFKAILDELGNKRACRIAYSDGILEIRMPSPKHEKAKVLIGDMVKILLEELNIDNECFGSSTFKRQDMAKGIEPDHCFYIENYAQMIGKDRIELTIDPPPDLAIEVDVTSKTGLDAYQSIGVPELWRFEDGRLRISLWQDGQYEDASYSPNFPSFPIIEGISEFLARSQTVGRSQTLKAFRQWVREFAPPIE